MNAPSEKEPIKPCLFCGKAPHQYKAIGGYPMAVCACDGGREALHPNVWNSAWAWKRIAALTSRLKVAETALRYYEDAYCPHGSPMGGKAHEALSLLRQPLSENEQKELQ